MMKILLPVCFIAFKITGCFIDFILGLSTSDLKNIFGGEIAKSFNFRTCVNPKLIKMEDGETKIVYQSLTAKDLLQH